MCAIPASSDPQVLSPRMKRAASTALSPWRAKNNSARAMCSGRIRNRCPKRSTNGLPPRCPRQQPMSAPTTEPRKPNKMTSTMLSVRAAAHAAAASNRASPGKGTPALAMRRPSPAAGYPSASTIAVGFTGLPTTWGGRRARAASPPGGENRAHSSRSYTDGVMADYGDHESSDDPLHILRHSTAHLLAAALMELDPDAHYGIGPPVQDGFYHDL